MSTLNADNPEFRLEVLYALQSGPTRFKELWARVESSGLIRTKMTLLRYLKALEEEGLIKRTRASHKSVLYEIMPGEQGSWLLAAGPPGPFYGRDVEWIIKSMPCKAIAVHVAISYAFEETMQKEAAYAPVKILAGRPRYRAFFEPKLAKSKSCKEDWSDSMISWHSRGYRVFLKALRGVLEKYPEHVQAYLSEKPCRRQDRGARLDILRRVLAENVSAAERDQVLAKAEQSSEFEEVHEADQSRAEGLRT